MKTYCFHAILVRTRKSFHSQRRCKQWCFLSPESWAEAYHTSRIPGFDLEASTRDMEARICETQSPAHHTEKKCIETPAMGRGPDRYHIGVLTRCVRVRCKSTSVSVGSFMHRRPCNTGLRLRTRPTRYITMRKRPTSNRQHVTTCAQPESNIKNCGLQRCRCLRHDGEDVQQAEQSRGAEEGGRKGRRLPTPASKAARQRREKKRSAARQRGEKRKGQASQNHIQRCFTLFRSGTSKFFHDFHWHMRYEHLWDNSEQTFVSTKGALERWRNNAMLLVCNIERFCTHVN